MDSLHGNLRLLLDGLPCEELNPVCDISSKDLTEGTELFRPVVKKTVCYIVAAVLFNEKGDVLLMQEAKASCRGKWYLPAGRMEAGEDITEAAKREVTEETGLEFDPTTLLMVESNGGAWFRFIVTGYVVGGRLKTPEEADDEALQAMWVPDLAQLPLRAKDILPLVEIGRRFRAANANKEPWHNLLLPSIHPHQSLLLRTFIVGINSTNNKVNVLVSQETSPHLPLCQINPAMSVWWTMAQLMVAVFGSEIPKHAAHGLLAVEHTGHPTHANDGFCFTLLVSIKDDVKSVRVSDKYLWIEMGGDLGDEILGRLHKNMTVPLVVLR